VRTDQTIRRGGNFVRRKIRRSNTRTHKHAHRATSRRRAPGLPATDAARHGACACENVNLHQQSWVRVGHSMHISRINDVATDSCHREDYTSDAERVQRKTATSVSDVIRTPRFSLDIAGTRVQRVSPLATLRTATGCMAVVCAQSVARGRVSTVAPPSASTRCRFCKRQLAPSGKINHD
jgi:hypothetical protein